MAHSISLDEINDCTLTYSSWASLHINKCILYHLLKNTL